MTGFDSKRQAALDKVAEMLELCDYLECNDASLEAQCKAAAFIREALAQPVQEPVAWSDEHLQFLNFLYGAGEFDGVWFDQKHPKEKGEFWWRKHLRRLFDAPTQRPWVGLTAEEVKHEWEVWRVSLPRYVGFAKGIETKLKEKNT
jgi:hypothetical protein